MLADIYFLLAPLEIFLNKPAMAPLIAKSLSAFAIQKTTTIKIMTIQIGKRMAIKKSHAVAPVVVTSVGFIQEFPFASSTVQYILFCHSKNTPDHFWETP